jgi:hypothetical protein
MTELMKRGKEPFRKEGNDVRKTREERRGQETKGYLVL